MGIGMVVITGPNYLQFVQDKLNVAHEPFYIIGEVVDGNCQVKFL
jgi:phosphoribosylaminoimidazole (AIR) synthetase